MKVPVLKMRVYISRTFSTVKKKSVVGPNMRADVLSDYVHVEVGIQRGRQVFKTASWEDKRLAQTLILPNSSGEKIPSLQESN